MCIIVIKPKHKAIQSKELLQECFTSNRDGAGYMYVNKHKEVVIKKGFMTFEDFYTNVIMDYDEYNLEEQNLVMHFRIGTSGKNALGCTHPFPITDKYDDMELIDNKTNIGICHNGIISQFNDRYGKYSDTEIYIATVMTPLIRLNLQAYKFKDVQELILKTTTSKWAVLDKNDMVYTVGNFISDDGYFYSNTSYIHYEYIPAKYVPQNKNKWNKKDYNIFDEEEEDLNQQNKWWEEARLKSMKKSEKNDTTKYRDLHIGNIITGGTIEYLDVERENEFVFNEDYDVFEKTKDGKLKIVDYDTVIYVDESLNERRDF